MSSGSNEAAIIGCKHTNLNHMVFRYAVKLSYPVLNDDTHTDIVRSSQHLFDLLHTYLFFRSRTHAIMRVKKMQRPAKQSRKTSAENVCDSAKTWADSPLGCTCWRKHRSHGGHWACWIHWSEDGPVQLGMRSCPDHWWQAAGWYQRSTW